MQKFVITCVLISVILTTFFKPTFGQNAELLIWRNLTELLHGGWYIPSSWGYGQSFSKPSELHEDLEHLDADSSFGVWTGSIVGTYFLFAFQLYEPAFCGITEANVTVRFYCRAAPGRMTVYPCINGPSSPCRLNCTGTWNTEVVEINTKSTVTDKLSNATVSSSLSSEGYVLLDEVWLSHNGHRCDIVPTTVDPPSTTELPLEPCNESCEYVGVDCHTYYTCTNFQYKTYHNCSQEYGLAFNSLLGVCDRVENVEGCGLPEDCGSEYKADPSNCRNYFYCPHKCRQESCEWKSCPGDLLWSTDAEGHQQCTLPELASCA